MITVNYQTNTLNFESSAKTHNKILIISDHEMLRRVLVADFNKIIGTSAITFEELDFANDIWSQISAVVLHSDEKSKKAFVVLDKLKTDHRTSNIPVIVMSNKFSPADEELAIELGASDFLSALASQTILCYKVLNHANTFNKIKLLKEKASIDNLTGLINKNAFSDCLSRACASAVRGKYPLALAILDVDGFKQYNDYYGHLSGDKCLAKIGATLQNMQWRCEDVVARVGGEEFAIILPHSNMDGAHMVISSVISKIYDCKINHAPRYGHPYVSVSAGISNLTQAGSPLLDSTIDELYESADKQLYCAKAKGKNQLSCELP